MQSSMIQVHEYFKCHLQRRSWQELPKDTQTAAVKMAEEDIMLALNCNALDTGDLLVIILLLQMAGDCAEDQNTALLTLALYLFL